MFPGQSQKFLYRRQPVSKRVMQAYQAALECTTTLSSRASQRDPAEYPLQLQSADVDEHTQHRDLYVHLRRYLGFCSTL
jgi:hypothetical protein